jgi:phage tail-like protein
MIPGLESPHPMALTLPAVYQEDALTTRMMPAFDEVLAPVFCTLDCLEAYIDPQLAPPDFIEWLATWVGWDLDEKWDEDRRRLLISQAVELYRWRGTKKGLAMAVEALTGITPEIIESGAATFSLVPGTDPPGSPFPQVIVRLTMADAEGLDPERLDAIVADTKPAHIPHIIEVSQA